MFVCVVEWCYLVNEWVIGIVYKKCNDVDIENDVIVFYWLDIVIKWFENRYYVKDKVRDLW